MPIETKYARERLLELLIGERVTERIERTVEVAEIVGEVVERRRDAVSVGRAEPDDQREHVPRRPTADERPQNDSDRPQRLPRPIRATTFLIIRHKAPADV